MKRERVTCAAMSNLPMDCSPPGSSVHGILQARTLEWVAIPFSRGPPDPGTEPGPPLQADSGPSASPGKPTGTVGGSASAQQRNYVTSTQWFPTGNQSWIFIGWTDAEAPILWPPDAKNWLIRKDPDAAKDWKRKEKGMTEDEMVGWHHQFDGHEFELLLAGGDGQGSLVRCSSRGRRESDTTEQINWTELNVRSHSTVVVITAYWCYYYDGDFKKKRSRLSDK